MEQVVKLYRFNEEKLNLFKDLEESINMLNDNLAYLGIGDAWEVIYESLQAVAWGTENRGLSKLRERGQLLCNLLYINDITPEGNPRELYSRNFILVGAGDDMKPMPSIFLAIKERGVEEVALDNTGKLIESGLLVPIEIGTKDGIIFLLHLFLLENNPTILNKDIIQSMLYDLDSSLGRLNPDILNTQIQGLIDIITGYPQENLDKQTLEMKLSTFLLDLILLLRKTITQQP